MPCHLICLADEFAPETYRVRLDAQPLTSTTKDMETYFSFKSWAYLFFSPNYA